MFLRSSIGRLLIFFGTALFISVGTFLMIRYAKGYRPTLKGELKGTGLLNATSFPPGAEVYINDRLTTATNTTLNLSPERYNIAIKKDGYHAWNKNIQIESELVRETNAQLFPTSPSLEPLTYTGAINPVNNPDGNKLVYAVASASASAKNGLYVQDLSTSTISLSRSSRQIARSDSNYDYTKASYTWSPNSQQILVAFPTGANILLDSGSMNDLGTLKDVTVTLPQIFREWELDLAQSSRPALSLLPEFMQKVATTSATNLYPNPDGDKLLYQATADLEIPEDLIPNIPSTSTEPEERKLLTGHYYIYDIKEDKNFHVALDYSPIPLASPVPSINPKTSKAKILPNPVLIEPPFTITKRLLLDDLTRTIPAELGSDANAFRRLQTNLTVGQSIALFNAQYSSITYLPIQWYPDGTHIVVTSNTSIDILEYDGTNRVTLYAGPFDPKFVYPWPDGSRLITRIQFSPDTASNLYTIKLK